MSYDYAAYKKSLECLFGLGALDKIKLLLLFHIVRVQVPPSGEETGPKITLRGLSCTECISGKKQFGVYTDSFTGNHVRWLDGIQRPIYALGHYANSG
ncbi:hypothetical protein TNCV_2561271 [Trichonephila clavipes]|uniref:Uncharacterized protein n=1 Tax=Trichonephila clavipes TaxID=2585209 RepID=A0A8X6R2B4_TRICX|nr:hypothetical protein TNCV_2561271 [Trichonephila clavipes]